MGNRATSSTGGATTAYSYDTVGGLPVLLGDGSQKYVWANGLAYVSQGADAFVFHADGLGSIRAVTDASARVVATYETDEFGAPTADAGGLAQPFGYTGEQRDPTGLVNLRARLYDPQVGRFLSRDSFAGVADLPASLNRYSYVHNNPVNETDPSGNSPLLLACGVGAVGSVALDAGMDWLNGEKTAGSKVLRSAAEGCVGGLTGFGVAKVAGKLLPAAITATLGWGSSAGSSAVLEVAAPRTFQRTHALSGRASSRLVRELAESMRSNGWQGKPIDVFEHNGTRYVLDGHHCLEAARRVGLDVPYRIRSEADLPQFSHRSVRELLDAAANAGRNRLRR